MGLEEARNPGHKLEEARKLGNRFKEAHQPTKRYLAEWVLELADEVEQLRGYNRAKDEQMKNMARRNAELDDELWEANYQLEKLGATPREEEA